MERARFSVGVHVFRIILKHRWACAVAHATCYDSLSGRLGTLSKGKL